MNDGGSAYPVLDNPGDGTLYCRDGGMTLRDYFAAQIAAGMAAHSGTSGISYGPHDIAGRANPDNDMIYLLRDCRAALNGGREKGK